MNTNNFDWSAELHSTVVKSLTTTFGLDFLLFEDKTGGDVDTIHNVRQGIHATKAEQQRYEQRESYDSHAYHKHENYIKTNREGKEQRLQGNLQDAYTGKTFDKNAKTNLDHIISAKEIHDDAGRILAGLDGTDLANQSSNLLHTNESLNKAKQAKSMDSFIQKLQQEYQATTQEIAELRNMPVLNEQQQKLLQKLEYKANADFQKMKEADKKARKQYNATINSEYYTSSKFALSVSRASLISGFKMGTRQMLGLVLAEVWFEFRERIPVIYQQHRNNFDALKFVGDLGQALRAVWERIRGKFHQFLITFKDGAIGGILSTVTTTLFNIFFTTQRMMVRLIREMWNSLVQAFKLLVFNPQKLSPGDLMQAVSKIITTGVALVFGVIINEQLAKVFVFPFGTELAAFCGALATGLLTLTMNYFLEHSEIMKKVWAFLNQFKDKFKAGLEYYQKLNAELDRYLKELSRLEFSMDTTQLTQFANRLTLINSELERGFILQQEIERRNIALPFEANNIASVKNWLQSL